ncbi:cell division control protein Cdc6 [Halonotius pteroides]|uniref:ORC1-type DNA replication protein n=2 Tax=Halonotius pteroides TaxID=268735 RepID=A0A3A6QKE6_9EURY|nr:cell division control protein Cdc6 [Halonotius pteroides]
MEVNLFTPTVYSKYMAGSDQDGANQSTLDEENSSTSDGQQLESAREDATGGSSQNQELAEEGAQRSIRDMLDDEGGASVFVNRDLVEPDTIINEERIVGRDDQLESVVSFLKPTLQGNRPPNMLLYGPAGTGKSLIIGAVTRQIIELCQSKGERFGVVDVNCQPINTLDQAVYELVQTVAQDVGTEIGVPETGVSTKRKYRRLYGLINEHYDSVIFTLDEIDLLVGRRENDEPAYSKLLYQLSRASNTDEIEGRVSVAALTNDPKFMEDIDGRAESSFNPRDVYFPDYDATQLREILNNRCDAFREDALDEDVIPLVAAFAAQSHGDARKAIDLFRGAGDLADEQGDEVVTEDHVRESQEEIDKDRSLKLVEGLTTQKKISLYATAAVAHHSKRTGSSVPSPVGFKVYQWVTNELDADQMTRETYVKYVKELSTYGLISTSRKSRGRGGGMYMEFTFTGDPEAMMTRIVDDTRLEGIAQEKELLSSVVNAQLKEFHEE